MRNPNKPVQFVYIHIGGTRKDEPNVPHDEGVGTLKEPAEGESFIRHIDFCDTHVVDSGWQPAWR